MRFSKSTPYTSKSKYQVFQMIIDKVIISSRWSAQNTMFSMSWMRLKHLGSNLPVISSTSFKLRPNFTLNIHVHPNQKAKKKCNIYDNPQVSWVISYHVFLLNAKPLQIRQFGCKKKRFWRNQLRSHLPNHGFPLAWKPLHQQTFIAATSNEVCQEPSIPHPPFTFKKKLQ